VLYRKALELNPDFAEAYCGLGATYQEAGHLEEAAGYFQQALARQQDLTDVIFNLAMLRADQGRFTEALELTQNGQDLRPDDSNGWLARDQYCQTTRPESRGLSPRRARLLTWNGNGCGPRTRHCSSDSTKPPSKVDDAGSVLA